MNTVTRLLKCVLLLPSDDHIAVAQEIQASCDSCVMEAWARCDQKDEYVVDCFRWRLCISLAHNTAFICLVNIIVCAVRFDFESNDFHIPFIMTLCSAFRRLGKGGPSCTSCILSELLLHRLCL